LDGSDAHGINDAGQIVGTYGDAGGFHGFLLSSGAYTTLDVPGEIYTGADDINDRGQIVGLYRDASDVRHGFLLTDGSYVTIDPPGATFAVAVGITSSGEIAGTYGDASGTDHGFLATPIRGSAPCMDRDLTSVQQTEPRSTEALQGLFAEELQRIDQLLASKDCDLVGKNVW
jgi:probable HAF family extracellular repeat protein